MNGSPSPGIYGKFLMLQQHADIRAIVYRKPASLADDKKAKMPSGPAPAHEMHEEEKGGTGYCQV